MYDTGAAGTLKNKPKRPKRKRKTKVFHLLISFFLIDLLVKSALRVFASTPHTALHRALAPSAVPRETF